jgi:hypothetical protein
MTTHLSAVAIVVAIDLAGLAGGCGTSSTVAAPPVETAAVTPAGPGEWLASEPEGCVLGQSGPTLEPSAALKEARRRARAALVKAVAKMHEQALSVVAGSGEAEKHHGVILEQAEGWARRSTIVALWYDDQGTGPEHAPGTAYAAACLLEEARPATKDLVARREEHRAGPAWVYGVAHPAGQICATGVSRPAMEPKDALASAEAAARDEVAEGIAAHLKLLGGSFDEETAVGAAPDVPASCREQAAKAHVVATWVDEHGYGPVPFAGTSYAFVCASP